MSRVYYFLLCYCYQPWWTTSSDSDSYARRYTHKRSYVALRSIGLHQVSYEAVASSLQVKVVWAVYISFHTIVTNYNEPLESDIARIDDARHIKWCQDTEIDHYTVALSSILIYGLQMTYPMLEFICRPHGCAEEAWLLKLVMYHLNITEYKH